MKPTWIAMTLILITSRAWAAVPAEDHSMHGGDHGHAVMTGTSTDSDSPAKLLADKKESEFNHHLAGLLVMLGGLFMLAQRTLTHKWPSTKYVWPSTFLLSGLFVLVWSDTELWPFGNRQWLEALQNNLEVLQHKIFAVLLLGLGCVEWRRANGKLKAVWSRMIFPLLAVGGSLLLLFHRHDAGMHGPGHMEVMLRIQSEHAHYAAIGIGLGIAKALAELRMRWQRVFTVLWPLLMAGLGFLLMFYRE